MCGFNARNINTIDELYICAVCSHILKEPYQLECGHRQCESCIEAVEEYREQILIEIKISLFS